MVPAASCLFPRPRKSDSLPSSPFQPQENFYPGGRRGRERVDSSTSLNFKTFPRPVEVVDPRGCCLFLSELTSRPSPFLRIYIKNRVKNRFISKYINRRNFVHFKLVFRMLKVQQEICFITLLKLFEQQISGYFSKRKEKGKLDVN